MHPGPVCPGPAPLGVTPRVPFPPPRIVGFVGLAPGERRVEAGTAGSSFGTRWVPSLLPVRSLAHRRCIVPWVVLVSFHARKDTLTPQGGIPFAVVPRGRCDFVGGTWLAYPRPGGWLGHGRGPGGLTTKVAPRARHAEGRGGQQRSGSIPGICSPRGPRTQRRLHVPPAATVARRPPKWASPLRDGRVPLPPFHPIGRLPEPMGGSGGRPPPSVRIY